MLYFGSRNFGQANFGKGLITTSVSNSTTSSMGVAGYLLFNTCTLDPTATTNVDIAGGIQRTGNLHVKPSSTVTMSGIKMEWKASVSLGTGTGTMMSSGYIAWDSQFIPTTTWTTQEVD